MHLLDLSVYQVLKNVFSAYFGYTSDFVLRLNNKNRRPERQITCNRVTAACARPGVHRAPLTVHYNRTIFSIKDKGMLVGMLGLCVRSAGQGWWKPRMVLLSAGRSMGTHGGKEAKERLNSPKRAREFIYRLQPAERACLLAQLQEFQAVAVAQETQEPTAPTSAQIRYILLHNSIPFVGFGFLDNAIMIAAGTQIEVSIGVTLGISTMAAAALGNLVSDLAGLGLAGYVESLVSKLGMQGPDLTPKQADMWQTRVSSHLGKAIGVTIGCILGMFPLLFISEDDDDKEGKTQSDA